MNIHPIFVHFPIAFLSMYTIFELIRPARLMKSREWMYVKAILLFVGGLGALAALFTGDFGKSLFAGERALISVHENFAHMVVILFGLLAIVYMIAVIEDLFGHAIRKTEFASPWHAIVKGNKYLFNGYVLVPAAILGFCLVFITGALGGTIVFGPSNDVFTKLVNQIFVH